MTSHASCNCSLNDEVGLFPRYISGHLDQRTVYALMMSKSRHVFLKRIQSNTKEVKIQKESDRKKAFFTVKGDKRQSKRKIFLC